MGSRTIYRSAKTGRIVTEAYAELNPERTIREILVDPPEMNYFVSAHDHEGKELVRFKYRGDVVRDSGFLSIAVPPKQNIREIRVWDAERFPDGGTQAVVDDVPVNQQGEHYSGSINLSGEGNA